MIDNFIRDNNFIPFHERDKMKIPEQKNTKIEMKYTIYEFIEWEHRSVECRFKKERRDILKY